ATAKDAACRLCRYAASRRPTLCEFPEADGRTRLSGRSGFYLRLHPNTEYRRLRNELSRARDAQGRRVPGGRERAGAACDDFGYGGYGVVCPGPGFGSCLNGLGVAADAPRRESFADFVAGARARPHYVGERLQLLPGGRPGGIRLGHP